MHHLALQKCCSYQEDIRVSIEALVARMLVLAVDVDPLQHTEWRKKFAVVHVLEYLNVIVVQW